MSLETLEKAIAQFPRTPTGVRNKAIYGLTWAAAAKTHEILRLRMTDDKFGSGFVEIEDAGVVLKIKRNNPMEGDAFWFSRGLPVRNKSSEFCPKQLLEDWLAIRGDEAGFLFPAVKYSRVHRETKFHSNTFSKHLQEMNAKLGFSPDEFNCESFKTGCINWLVEQGVPISAVMAHSGYKNMKSIVSRLRGAAVIKSSPLSDTSWTD